MTDTNDYQTKENLRRPIFTIIVGVLAIAGIILGISAIVNTSYRNDLMSNGIQTVATPTGELIEEYNGRAFQWYIEYRYKIGEKEYIAKGRSDYNTERNAKDALGETDTVALYYMEGEPTRYFIDDHDIYTS